MDLLSALRRSRTRRRTGQPTRCVRTMPPRSPDAARGCGRARSGERSELNDHRTGARRRRRPMRCGHPSFRGAETSAAGVGASPAVVDRTGGAPGRFRAGPTHPPSSSEPVEPSWTSEERSSQMRRSVGRARPEPGRRRRGVRAVSRVRGEAQPAVAGLSEARGCGRCPTPRAPRRAPAGRDG